MLLEHQVLYSLQNQKPFFREVCRKSYCHGSYCGSLT
jgi:hypothetical protein